VVLQEGSRGKIAQNKKLQKEIDCMGMAQSTQVGKSPSISSSKEKKEGYSRLEQKQHEKTRADFSKRNEMKAKSEGKINRAKSALVGDT